MTRALTRAQLIALLPLRITCALRAPKARRELALRAVAESLRHVRELSGDDAAALAELIVSKPRAAPGGRPREDSLHALVLDVYAVKRSWYKVRGLKVSNAQIYRELACIRWPIETNERGDPLRERKIGAAGIRDIVERRIARARGKPPATI